MKVWEAVKNTFIEMGIFDTSHIGVETSGGSATIVTDSALSLTADAEINGVLMLLSGGASPEGKFSKITDNGTDSFTIDTVTDNVDVGDYFGWTTEFKAADILFMVNLALDKIQIAIVDTSLTSASNQTEYEMPLTIAEGDILSIGYPTNPDDANDLRMTFLSDWRIRPDTAGNTPTLIIPQIPSGRTIYIEHKGYHPAVTAYNSEIHETIHRDLMKAALKVVIYDRRSEGAINSVKGYNLGNNKAQDELDKMLAKYPPFSPDRQRKYFATPSPRETIVIGPGKVRL